MWGGRAGSIPVSEDLCKQLINCPYKEIYAFNIYVEIFHVLELACPLQFPTLLKSNSQTSYTAFAYLWYCFLYFSGVCLVEMLIPAREKTLTLRRVKAPASPVTHPKPLGSNLSVRLTTYWNPEIHPSPIASRLVKHGRWYTLNNLDDLHLSDWVSMRF